MNYFFLLLCIGSLCACSHKYAFQTYADPQTGNETEERSLFLVETGKYCLRAYSETGGKKTWMYSIGKYRFTDSFLILTSVEPTLQLNELRQEPVKDSMYRIEVSDKYNELIENEEVVFIINESDTLSWVAQFSLHYNANSPLIKTIRIAYPKLNYVSDSYRVNSENNLLRFCFTSDKHVFSGGFIFLDNYTLKVNGDSVRELSPLQKSFGIAGYKKEKNWCPEIYCLWEEVADNRQYEYLLVDETKNRK